METVAMVLGAPYNSRAPELLALAHRARALMSEYAAVPSTDAAGRMRVLTDLLGSVGEGVWIEPPFYCDYGAHISIGAHTFVNVNAVFLDSARITIGEKVLIGPGVQLLTAFHPLRAEERLPATWTPESGLSPYVTQAAPITIGDGAWIGAGALVMPGITIGARAVIGAGSVVTKNIPADAVAYGNPAAVAKV